METTFADMKLPRRFGRIVPMSLTARGLLATILLLLSSNLFAQSAINCKSGADIAPAVSAAINSLGSSPGTILITTGTCNWSTAVKKPHWITIDGQNSVINVTSPTAAIVCGETSLPPAAPETYAQGGIRNITLIGNGQSKSVGIWLGADPTGNYAPTAFLDTMETFYNVHVQNFSEGYAIGNLATQASWIDGSITENGDGVYYVANSSPAENLNMHGTQILNNGQGNYKTGYGINNSQHSAGELSLYGVSLDYNTSGAINWYGGGLSLFGGHLEQCNHYLINGTPNTSAITVLNLVAPVLALTGGSANCPSGTTSDTAMIYVGGTSAQVYVHPGLSAYIWPGHTVQTLIDWEATGSVNTLMAEPYWVQTINGGVWQPPLQPAQAGANINSYEMAPLYINGSLQGLSTVRLNADFIQKGGGSFKIDHPLDPEKKTLSHSFVESPDMMNIYDGIVDLNDHGEAWVHLPDYFQALNEGFRYELTSVGQPQPGLHVAREVADNRFKIAGGRPKGKVSWQVTGIRHDAFAKTHRVVVEEKKLAESGSH